MVKNVELKMHRNVVRTDLIVLPTPMFDIILIMDWLTLNEAIIDFHQRLVSIRPPNGKSFIFEAVQNKQLRQIVSCIRAKKLSRRGCQGFLASIISIPDIGSQSIKDVEVFKDFPDVFLDEVSGVPPERDVEFAIELMSGTVPISNASYHLAHAEIKELKYQIQELLDKVFIRPSFSPWDASVLFVKKRMGV
ncbi:uncharacterized protein [Primulina eburnea]|uniref:uncharacterized protein n=1 Tax=Primulina eburnea TaxID=1245227 RepID=UPI003C6C26AF